MKPTDIKLYEHVKKEIYHRHPKHSAYRSGLLVKEYKRRFRQKYGASKQPYIGVKNKNVGLQRWFKEEWRNSRGEVGYKYKNDVYRPTRRITRKTPKTFKEISKKKLRKSRRKKYKKGRVDRF